MQSTSSPAPLSSPFGPYEVRWCAVCADERVFEVPPCEDGHGEGCLDLTCGECGHAIVLGGATADAAVLLEVRAA